MKRILGYSAGGIGDSATYTFINNFLLFFLSDVANIAPAIAGTVIAIGTVADALFGPVIGYISDNIGIKGSNRRPYIFIASFPLSLSCILLFINIDMPDGIKPFYYGFLTILFWLSFAGFFVPHISLGADITDDYHKRSVLRGFTYLANSIGMVIGLVLPTIVLAFFDTPEKGWMINGIIVGVFAFLTIQVTVFTTKGADKFAKPEKKVSLSPLKMFKSYFEVLKLKPLLILLSVAIIYLVANTFNSAIRMYFLNYKSMLTNSEISFFMFIITVLGAAFMPVFILLTRLTDKKISMFIGLFVSGVLIVVFRFLSLTTLTPLIIFAIIYAFGTCAYWQIMPATVYDVIEYDKLKNGKERGGAITSLLSLAEAFASAVSMQILGLILQFTGTSQYTNFFTVVPGILCIIAALILLAYPISKKEFEKIKEKL